MLTRLLHNSESENLKFRAPGVSLPRAHPGLILAWREDGGVYPLNSDPHWSRVTLGFNSPDLSSEFSQAQGCG